MIEENKSGITTWSCLSACFGDCNLTVGASSRKVGSRTVRVDIVTQLLHCRLRVRQHNKLKSFLLVVFMIHHLCWLGL